MKTVVLAHRALIPVFKKLLNLELQLNYILLLIKYIMLKYSITEKSRLKMDCPQKVRHFLGAFFYV